MLFGAGGAARAAPSDYEDGAYTAATNTYYLNPDTGVTDDGGTKNAALGEGMCRSVVYKTALVELDGGKIYVTVRLQLMSNMKDFRLYVQDKPKGGYTAVKPRVMAEDASADTADYRFEIPSVTAYMSWEMYVIPMGRDVKFYMNLSDSLTSGGADFVVSVKPKGSGKATEAGETTEPASTPTSASTLSPTPTLTPTPTTTPTPAPSLTQTPAATPTPAPELTPTPTETASPSQTPETAPQSTSPDTPAEVATDDGADAPESNTSPSAPDGGEIPDGTPPPDGGSETPNAPEETAVNPEPSRSAGREADVQAPEVAVTPNEAVGALAANDEPLEISSDGESDTNSASGAGGVAITAVVIAVVAATVIVAPRIVRKRK
jgi:hypothetical protein